jgi:UDP-glucuronate 4-epimerase
MRYVVTGAAGFIGSHLTFALKACGHDVVAVDSFTDYYDPCQKEANARCYDVIRADLAEAPLEALFAGTDGVYHLAGQPGVRESFGTGFLDYVSRNVLATQRVFEAASALNIRVVFASSSSVYGDAECYPTSEDTPPRPISPYGITKLACEHLAYSYGRNFGLDGIGLRYFTVYGPRQRPDMAFAKLVSAVAHGRTFELYGDGSQSREFTYVSDAVDATMGAMERGRRGAIYNVGGGSETTMLEAIGVLEQIAGRTIQIAMSAAQRGDVRRTAADIGRISADVGWEPCVTLDEGLSAQWRAAVGDGVGAI